jgi:hypothetical protein
MRVGYQRHAMAALLSEIKNYPFYGTLVGPQGRSGLVRKISPPNQTGLWYDIYLTAVGLTPSGSSTSHIYTQTIHIIQRKENWEKRAVPRLRKFQFPDRPTLSDSRYRLTYPGPQMSPEAHINTYMLFKHNSIKKECWGMKRVLCVHQSSTVTPTASEAGLNKQRRAKATEIWRCAYISRFVEAYLFSLLCQCALRIKRSTQSRSFESSGLRRRGSRMARQLHNKEVHNTQPFVRYYRMIKSRKAKWAQRV